MGKKLLILDGMRGVAAIMVLVIHFGKKWDFAPSGYLSVDLFFLLSGFVISAAYSERIDSGMASGEFIRMRIIRLYPMYLMGMLGCLALGSIYPPVTVISLGLGLLMLPSPQTHVLYPFMAQGWSLFFEIIANLLFVSLHRHLTTLRLSVLMILAAGSMFVLSVDHGNIGGGWVWDSFALGLARVLFSFFGGVLIWRYRAQINFRFHPVAILSIIVLVSFYSPEKRIIFDFIVVILLWPLLLMVSINSNSNSPLLRFLGEISYPLYCLHGMFALGVLKPEAPIGALALSALSIGMAWTAYHYYDQPMRSWLIKRTSRF